MPNQFKKLLQMMNKAGGKLVLFDADSEESYILLPLSEYQQQINGINQGREDTETEVLELSNPGKEQLDHDLARSQIQKVESELIPGILTEVVEIEGQNEQERVEEAEERFYFEALDSESEVDKKLSNEVDKE